MKTIQKLTLGLLTVAAFSTSASASELLVNFSNGAELEGDVTGSVKAVGDADASKLTLSGIASGNLNANKGIVEFADQSHAASFEISGTGGLSVTAVADFSVKMTAAGQVSAADALSIGKVAGGANMLTVVGTDSTKSCTLNALAANGGIDISGFLDTKMAAVALGANNMTFEDLDLSILPASATGTVNASAVLAATVDVPAATFGLFTANTISIGAKKWSQDITAA